MACDKARESCKSHRPRSAAVQRQPGAPNATPIGPVLLEQCSKIIVGSCQQAIQSMGSSTIVCRRELQRGYGSCGAAQFRSQYSLEATAACSRQATKATGFNPTIGEFVSEEMAAAEGDAAAFGGSDGGAAWPPAPAGPATSTWQPRSVGAGAGSSAFDPQPTWQPRPRAWWMQNGAAGGGSSSAGIENVYRGSYSSLNRDNLVAGDDEVDASEDTQSEPAPWDGGRRLLRRKQ